jgi:hypothetical protein
MPMEKPVYSIKRKTMLFSVVLGAGSYMPSVALLLHALMNNFAHAEIYAYFPFVP